MTNNQYITALKKALAGLDRASRDDIIQEIQSHAAESGKPLLERFGSPDELAKQYLDGEIIANPVGKKILGIGKKLFAWIGIGFVVLIAAVALFIWYMSGDDFNYADENAAELKSQSADWVSKEWDAPLTIKLDQAATVFYWHDAKSIRWSCLGDTQPRIGDDAVMSIRHSKCLVFLPKTAVTMNATQSETVIVRPQVSLDINMEQASLRVAENGVKYRYVTDASRSKIEGLQSHDDAEYTISIKSHESMVAPYQED